MTETGFAKLDAMIGVGFRKGELIVFTASNKGKSFYIPKEPDDSQPINKPVDTENVAD